MRYEDEIKQRYFEWMADIVCGDLYSRRVSFRKLLSYLHNVEFRYTIPRDRNREMDGLDLRYQFALDHRDIPNADAYLDGPCTVLEMMVALAIRCENETASDPDIGDRTGQWFWGMIVNLGLGGQLDHRFDERLVEKNIERFLNRDYDPDGRGGLFTIKNRNCDLRDVEIYYQLNWYMDDIV